MDTRCWRSWEDQGDLKRRRISVRSSIEIGAVVLEGCHNLSTPSILSIATEQVNQEVFPSMHQHAIVPVKKGLSSTGNSM